MRTTRPGRPLTTAHRSDEHRRSRCPLRRRDRDPRPARPTGARRRAARRPGRRLRAGRPRHDARRTDRAAGAALALRRAHRTALAATRQQPRNTPARVLAALVALHRPSPVAGGDRRAGDHAHAGRAGALSPARRQRRRQRRHQPHHPPRLRPRRRGLRCRLQRARSRSPSVCPTPGPRCGAHGHGRVASNGDIASVSPARISPERQRRCSTSIPAPRRSRPRRPTSSSTCATHVLPRVERSTATTILVGGASASEIDFTHVLSSKLLLFIAVVLILSALCSRRVPLAYHPLRRP